MQKIPVHIISGFLGSGKTTFLKRIIEKYSPGKRIGIIQNEFAPSNIDSKELKGLNQPFDLLEVNNGSVFCVCLLGDFVHSLAAFIDRHAPEILVMEASGLSDTTSVSELLSSPALSDKIYLAVNWCIIDALHFYKTGNFQQRLVHQIRMADALLINKTDLAGQVVPEVIEAVRKINPFASMTETTYCNVDPDLEMTPVPKFYFDNQLPLNRPDIRSMVIKTGRKITLAKLELFLKKWAQLAIRIKGFVNLSEGGTIAVQCTFGTIETRQVGIIYGPTELIALTEQFNLPEWNQSFRQFCE